MLYLILPRRLWRTNKNGLYRRRQVRRIKMLEYALKQERAKYAKLKYGNDAAGVDAMKPPLEEEGLEMPPIDGDNYIAVSNVNWRQGRQLLRQ